MPYLGLEQYALFRTQLGLQCYLGSAILKYTRGMHLSLLVHKILVHIFMGKRSQLCS